jgi:hypothetical protein
MGLPIARFKTVNQIYLLDPVGDGAKAGLSIRASAACGTRLYNIAAIKRLREKLRADRPAYGVWITLESASISEMAVTLGVDFIVVDAEHGHLDWKEILEHIRTAVRSSTVVLVRFRISGSLVKRVLDIGADGIIIP